MVTLENTNVGLRPNGHSQVVKKQAVVKANAAPAPSRPKVSFKTNNAIAERIKKLEAAEVEIQQQQVNKERKLITKRILERSVEKLKKLAEYISENTHLIARDYRVHEGTNRVTVKIYDSVTGEVIRELPGTEFLDRIAKMEKLLGIIFDNLV